MEASTDTTTDAILYGTAGPRGGTLEHLSDVDARTVRELLSDFYTLTGSSQRVLKGMLLATELIQGNDELSEIEVSTPYLQLNIADWTIGPELDDATIQSRLQMLAASGWLEEIPSVSDGSRTTFVGWRLTKAGAEVCSHEQVITGLDRFLKPRRR